MASSAGVGGDLLTWPWIAVFADAVESNAVHLEAEPAREQLARKIGVFLSEAVQLKERTASQEDEITKLLTACRIFMRDRRGLDALLTPEALESFLSVVEDRSQASSVRDEALKCMINSVHSRPEFVSTVVVSKGAASRLLELAKHGGSSSMHWLIWKFLLVSCEAPSMIQNLSGSCEVWELLHMTLLYGFHSGNPTDVVLDERSLLLLELLKLVAVLVNATQWTKEQELKRPETYRAIHVLGELLLAILRFSHPQISPLNAAVIELKNKAMEIFMLLPGPLLATFMQRQQPPTQDTDADSLLSPVVNHLRAMLLTVRVEKTRPLSEMLPTLIVCHNLASTNDPHILACFKQAILPLAKPTDSDSPMSSDRMKSLHFKHLTFFLTCLDTDVRRYTGEWLFLLCDQSANEYTRLTGVGNAIGLLRTKGLA